MNMCILIALWKSIPWATMHLQSMLGWIFSVLNYVREMFYTHYALDMGVFYPNVFRFFSPVSQYPHGGSVVAWIHNLHFDIACFLPRSSQTVCAMFHTMFTPWPSHLTHHVLMFLFFLSCDVATPAPGWRQRQPAYRPTCSNTIWYRERTGFATYAILEALVCSVGRTRL